MISKNILGLDISTNIIGYTILDNSGNHIISGALKLNKKLDFVARAAEFSSILADLRKQYSIGHVWIEEPFIMFAKGGSSAQTMARLSSFNGMIQFSCFTIYGFVPSMINANHARKVLGIKLMRQSKCGITTKDQIMSWVKTQLPNYKWPTKTLKSGPRKGLTINDDSCYDIADSFVVAKSGFVKMQNG